MYLIAGLGNPGRQYEMTRHNMGFSTLDYIADKAGIKISKLKYKALYGEGIMNGEKVILIKPQTYMNASGESIVDFVNFYKTDMQHLIVINDDISLPAGKIRIRPKGSDGGHNGLKSIIYLLGSDDFIRIKIGVGAPENSEYDIADYVLGRFSHDEIPIMENAIMRANDAVGEIMTSNVQTAMNKYNGNAE